VFRSGHLPTVCVEKVTSQVACQAGENFRVCANGVALRRGRGLASRDPAWSPEGPSDVSRGPSLRRRSAYRCLLTRAIGRCQANRMA